jgi:hypothetical protein
MDVSNSDSFLNVNHLIPVVTFHDIDYVINMMDRIFDRSNCSKLKEPSGGVGMTLV